MGKDEIPHPAVNKRIKLEANFGCLFNDSKFYEFIHTTTSLHSALKAHKNISKKGPSLFTHTQSAVPKKIG